MKLEREKYWFEEAELFLSLFGENVFLVGGYVRDIFMGKSESERGDADFLIVKTPPEVIEKKLSAYGRVDTTGKSFAVIRFRYRGKDFEVAIPRKDRKVEGVPVDHKNFHIQGDPFLPIEEDLKRRDFVCNSIALNLKTGKIVDPFGGVKDIENKILRMTNPQTFFDDPLRVLRAGRFASVLKFKLEEVIYYKAKETVLTELSKERVSEEFFKMLLKSQKPSTGLKEYFKLGILKQLFYPLYKTALTIQDAVFHPETDEFGHHTVFSHTLYVVDNAAHLGRKENFSLKEQQYLSLILGAIFHDVGKINTTEWEYKRGRMTITSNSHEIVGEEITEKLFDELNIHSYKKYPLRKMVLKLIRMHHRVHDLYKFRESATKKAISRLYLEFKDEIILPILLDTSDMYGRRNIVPEDIAESGKWFLKKLDEYEINRETVKPFLMGRDLIKMGLKEGPQIGKILKMVYDLQLEGKIKSKEEAILHAKKIIEKEL